MDHPVCSVCAKVKVLIPRLKALRSKSLPAFDLQHPVVADWMQVLLSCAIDDNKWNWDLGFVAQQIKKTMMKWHPDKNKSRHAEEWFSLLVECREAVTEMQQDKDASVMWTSDKEFFPAAFPTAATEKKFDFADSLASFEASLKQNHLDVAQILQQAFVFVSQMPQEKVILPSTTIKPNVQDLQDLTARTPASTGPSVASAELPRIVRDFSERTLETKSRKRARDSSSKPLWRDCGPSIKRK